MSTQESGERDPGLWQQGAAQRAQFLGPATELMLDLANLQEGSRVLDVAAGTGEQSLLAAQRLGVRGRLLAVYLPPPLLVEAEDRAPAPWGTALTTQGNGPHRLGHEPAHFEV